MAYSEETRRNLSASMMGKNLGKPKPPRTSQHREHISLSKLGNKNPMFGVHLNDDHKRKISIGLEKAYAKGLRKRKVSEETKQKISASLLGRTGRKLSEETKQKIRVARQKQGAPLGKNEKDWLDIFESYEKWLGNGLIIRQYPVLGYIADGYCPKSNTIYEVYEEHHHSVRQRKYDEKRQDEITRFLGCDFIIIPDIISQKV